MQQKTQGVSLREVVRRAFATLPEDGAGACGHPKVESPVVPFARTAGDRSRMRQKVLEELARRKQARRETEAAIVEPKGAPEASAAQAQPSLFPGDASASDERLSPVKCLQAVAGPRVGTRSCRDVREVVAAAYRSLMRRLPEDHVVLNPIANAEFIVRCRELGATVSEVVLNRTLLNNRKAKRHADVLRESVAGLEHGVYDQIGHAVEIAASLVQREWFATGRALPSVDDILCAPELRHAFKTYVHALCERADIVSCHLVLLAYRKSGRESARRFASVDVPDPLLTAPLQSLDPDDVPEGCGVYRVLCKRRPIFVSGTANLRQRILRHLATRDNGFLPASLPFAVDGPVSVQVYSVPSQWLPRRADAVARSMRIDEYPDLNWREKGGLFAEQSRVIPRRAAVG
jgi:hypothetical protein